MQQWRLSGNSRFDIYLILTLILVFVYLILASNSSRSDRRRQTRPEFVMSHHDHAAMMANAGSKMNHAGHNMMNNQNSAAVPRGLHDMMMAMTFHGGYQETILFDKWKTSTLGAFVASWFAIFFVAVLYEGLKAVRHHLSRRDVCPECMENQIRRQALIRSDVGEHDRPIDNDTVLTVKPNHIQSKRARLLSIPHIIQSVMHILQMAISYLLMLVAMTFNTYLFLAIVFGAGLGHFLFAWRRSSVIDYNEHCH
jgi:copper transporter 1